MVVLVLPLALHHGLGPAVDDVGPPGLRSGVAPGEVECPPCMQRSTVKIIRTVGTCVHRAAAS